MAGRDRLARTAWCLPAKLYHLHPDDAGYQAMADAASLVPFRR